ncbi:MAG: hypothetical protein FJ100_00155 [Deltaproteobacteria bacterium]|nr:hypothetical protein [Deltaproteobacteria bacterium]
MAATVPTKAARWAAVALATGLAACSASMQTSGKPAPARPAAEPAAPTPEEEVASAREAVERAPQGPDADRAQARLAEAIQKALKFHVSRADQALAGLDLGEAEAEIIAAAALDPGDGRVVELRGKAAEVRSQCTLAIGQVRGLLARLKPMAPRPQDASLWQELAEALTLLGQWASAFPESASLRADAAPLLAGWQAFLGEAAFSSGDAATADKHATAGAAWKPDHPAIVALRARLAAVGEVVGARSRVKSALEAGQFEVAVRAADEALAVHPADAELLALRAAAGQKAAQVHVEVAKAALKAGQVAQCAAAVAAARQLARGDAALAKILDGLTREFSKKVEKSLGSRVAALASRGLTGAAWIHGLALQAVLGADAKRDARIAKLDAELSMAARYLLAVDVAALPKDQAKELPAAMPGQVASASQIAVRQALTAPDLVALGLAVVLKGPADAAVRMAWPAWRMARRQEQETRKKDYLDHTDTVHNPAWDEAQARQVATMAKMNAANDELRPVIEEVNASEGKLGELQNQLAEIQKKIAADDADFYRDRPKPCPDGTARCPESWANKRWKANLDYYVRRIDEENKKLEALVPKLNRLQATADAARKAYDTSVDALERTPRNVPKEVWLPYTYEVTRHVVEIKARADFQLWQGAGKAAALAHQSAPALDEVRQDFTSGTVIVKGQLLEPQHASKLPEDATLVAEVVSRVLASALDEVKQRVAHHGERWIAKSEAAKGDDERVHYLVLAWRARGALPAERREVVARRLRDIAGFDAKTATVDVGRLELGK